MSKYAAPITDEKLREAMARDFERHKENEQNAWSRLCNETFAGLIRTGELIWDSEADAVIVTTLGVSRVRKN